MARILVISLDYVGRQMAGPAIRAWKFAGQLSREHRVTLAIPNDSDLEPEDFSLQRYNPRTLPALVDENEVVIAQGLALAFHQCLVKANRPLVLDLYDPIVLENLEAHRQESQKAQAGIHRWEMHALLTQLRAGDFFLCASERQRDFWLGMLVAAGRVNPLTYADDPTLRRLITVVPFGLPSDPPTHSQAVLKGVRPGIGPDDRVVLWGGGIWDWLDPAMAVEAVGQLAGQMTDVRLFFLGIRRPNPAVPTSHRVREAITLSRRLGLLDRDVFFNDWVPYDQRQNYLLEADVGISLHHDHAEGRYAFRTRVLDYIWAGLPMVLTAGDEMSELVERESVGTTVPANDPDALAEALRRLLATPDLRERCAPHFSALATQLTWEHVTQPLLAFCRQPRGAADKREGEPPPGFAAPSRARPPGLPTAYLMARAFETLRRRGPRSLAFEMQNYIRWRLGR